jgi:DHA2 family multidrug resistance protein
VVTSGLITAPRGIGTFISMFFAGRLINRLDARVMMLTGMVMLSFAFLQMSGFSLQMDARYMIFTGFIQGLATGLLFLPMSTLAFATLRPSLRADASGASALTRSLGNSIGISIMQAMFTRNSAVVHARLAEPIRPDNPILQASRGLSSLATPEGLAGMVGEVSRQAAMVAYVDVFRLMCVVTLVMSPLLLLVRPPARAQTDESEPIMVD